MHIGINSLVMCKASRANFPELEFVVLLSTLPDDVARCQMVGGKAIGGQSSDLLVWLAYNGGST